MRIGIDLMGSDTPERLLFEAVLEAAKCVGPSCSLMIIATQSVVAELQSFMSNQRVVDSSSKNILFEIAEEVITMEDEPLIALRRKKKASLILGMRMLKKRSIDAFVSCGNTGALIAAATVYLSKLPGILRPALFAHLPVQQGFLSILDVGGNIHCKAHHLVQFAHLGTLYHQVMTGIKSPRVGLLNIGAESKKGTKEVRHAYELLEADKKLPLSTLNFIGNIEARDVFSGVVDVVVTDGLTGNILLKSAEGVVSLILTSLAKYDNPIAKEILTECYKCYSYTEHPGAIVCGVDGIVIKVHGSAPPKALFSSIMGAADYVKKELLRTLKE